MNWRKSLKGSKGRAQPCLPSRSLIHKISRESTKKTTKTTFTHKIQLWFRKRSEKDCCSIMRWYAMPLKWTKMGTERFNVEWGKIAKDDHKLFVLFIIKVSCANCAGVFEFDKKYSNGFVIIIMYFLGILWEMMIARCEKCLSGFNKFPLVNNNISYCYLFRFLFPLLKKSL